MKKKIVAIDLDGVIWDMLPAWIELYNDVFNDNLTIDQIQTYDIERYTKCDKASLLYLLERDDFWEKITIPNKTVRALEDLQNNEKVELLIVTNTSHRTALHKFQRLFQLLPTLKESQIITTSRKDLIKADILIDDWEDNLKEMAKSKQGVPILITHTYNKTFPNTQYGILRVGDLATAMLIINELIQDIK